MDEMKLSSQYPADEVLRLCVLGTQAEYAGRSDEAAELYRQAWRAARDDYEACLAAHYVARIQDSPELALHWNEIALARAESSQDERVIPFYPSLYVNLGRSYELLGHMRQAEEFYQRAAQLGLDHDDPSLGSLR
jgi:tetratricopeptide (TPR) repeat protein